ncbi:MAG: iron-sulfur cluster assembly protein [Rhodospirillaceae bacterium]
MDDTLLVSEQTADKKPEDLLYERVVEVLRMVYDPEIPVNIWELGLVYGVEASADGVVAIKMTLTSPNCPVAEELPNSVHTVVMSIDVVTRCTVELVWEPPWNPGLMTDEAKVQLDMFY